MENLQNTLENISKVRLQRHRLGDQLIFRPSDNSSTLLRPVVPTGRIINLVPKYIPSVKKNTKYLTSKPKDPRFVPYEPYKAAIEPIIPRKKREVKKEIPKVSKNNVDIHDLVSQMSELASVELNKANKEALQNDEPLITRKKWEEEKSKYETDIKNLRESNKHLENQLKFQAQVNGELKTLLVAAVGEDLESRVQHLTQDKLSLARELLNSANHLTSHREHTEWLSGQCEVWRSKFLASSLMVEELARWKSALSNKILELKDTIKKLLDERCKVRQLSLSTHNNLLNLYEFTIYKSDIPDSEIILKKTNILETAKANKCVSELLQNILMKDHPQNKKHYAITNYDESHQDSHTHMELLALLALRNPVVLSDKPDVVYNAVMGAAMQMGKGQLFLQHTEDHAACCSHCKGEVKNV